MTELPEVKALVPYFGAARMVAKHVGASLDGCNWAGIPFAGSMSEVLYIKARTIVCNDLHRHIINLARCVADQATFTKLWRRLRGKLFHADELTEAQQHANFEPAFKWDGKADIDAAEAYFVACWMGRSGKSGTNSEFQGKLPVRWNAGGGDSAIRYRSAVKSLRLWRDQLQRCNFIRGDAFEFIAQCKDEPGHGIYCDPPFPGPGDAYRHTLDELSHTRLARTMERFQRTRCVMRFYDAPLIRLLYPERLWTWTNIAGGRKSTNAEAPEVLLTRN